MAKKYSLGRVLFVGAVSAALGGVAAYRRRKEIEKTVKDISDRLENLEEEGFFDVDLSADTLDDQDTNYIPVNFRREDETPAETDDEAQEDPNEAQESDFADQPDPDGETPET
jgi:hypothetical protein